MEEKQTSEKMTGETAEEFFRKILEEMPEGVPVRVNEERSGILVRKGDDLWDWAMYG